MRIPNFALKILFLLAIFAPYARAYEPLIPPKITVSQTREDQEEIINKGKALLAWQVRVLRTALGIDKHALEFLALDTLYNVPGRNPVYASFDQMRVYPVHMKYNSRDSDFFSEHFPKLKSDGKTHVLKLKIIKASGRGQTYFAVVPGRNIYFMVKKPFHPEDILQLMQFYTMATSKEGLKFEFVPEIPSHDGNKDQYFDTVLRPLNTQNKIATGKDSESKFLPLHGIFGSHIIHELAHTKGISTFEYVSSVFIPKLAELLFQTFIRGGMLFNSHTQNLWGRVFKKTGDIDLNVKDLQDVTFVPMMGEKNFVAYQMASNVTSTGFFAFKSSSPDNPKGRLPGFNFASYFLQSVVATMNYTEAEKAFLFVSFLNHLLPKVEAQLGVPLKFSDRTEHALRHLQHFTSDIDIKLPHSSTHIKWGEKLSGLYTLAERVVDEIYDQFLSVKLAGLKKVNDPADYKLIRDKKMMGGISMDVAEVNPLPLSTEIEQPKWSRWHKIRTAAFSKINDYMIKGLVSPLARSWKLNWADIHINSELLVAVDPKTKKPLVVFFPPSKCEKALASLYQKISLQEKNAP